jgi:hypothetical protein
MSSDFTEQQSPADLQRSKELSLAKSPPTEVPGYQTQRFLGSGAYGEVWVGVDRTTGRKVAIKFYLHRAGVDWSLLSREVEKLRFLSADRYVVQLLDVGWDAEPPYYVMEYVEHGSLDDLLRRHGTFTVPEAVELFEELAIGLAHAHGKGVVHCDLKPANVLLDQDQRPRLADFGQSRLSHEQKPALGTLFYMAPEQADLEAIPDVRWDVYALGAILYTLLVGTPPHRNDDTLDKIDSAANLSDRLARYRHAIRAAPPPSEHRKIPGMDRGMAEIIDRCLAVNPNDRFANVQEVLDALAARRRNRERLPLMVLGFVGPLLVLLVTAFFSYRGYARSVENAERGYAQYALESNQFASELAAKKVQAEISGYFGIAQSEVEQSRFRLPFFDVIEMIDKNDAFKPLINPIATESEREQAQARFQTDSQRRALERYLQERINRYQEAARRDTSAPRFASIFVNDRYGTQLASVFDDESVSENIGKNFAWRSYFHGGPKDLPASSIPPANPPHVERTHLSAAYQSTTQKTWKVAISQPIYRELGQTEFVGILVLTVNLGEFEVSRTGVSPSRDQFLVLVDGREEEQGTILYHPLFEDFAAKGKTIPDILFTPSYRVPKEVLQRRQVDNYRDPLSNYEADDGVAKAYDKRWLAAASPVSLTDVTQANADSGIIVLVQSDYQRVVQPSRELGRQFMRNSFAMFVVMVAVSLALWYIVVRLFREPRAGLSRPATPIPESTPIHAMPTIAARRRQ